MDTDQDSGSGKSDPSVEKLIDRLDEMEKRVERLENEMSAIGKMEGAIKSIFRGGDPKHSDET